MSALTKTKHGVRLTTDDGDIYNIDFIRGEQNEIIAFELDTILKKDKADEKEADRKRAEESERKRIATEGNRKPDSDTDNSRFGPIV